LKILQLKEETNKLIKQYYDENDKMRQETNGKLQTLRNEIFNSNDITNQRINMVGGQPIY
jgi:vacuolar-type H+-ATPase subunit H